MLSFIGLFSQAFKAQENLKKKKKKNKKKNNQCPKHPFLKNKNNKVSAHISFTL